MLRSQGGLRHTRARQSARRQWGGKGADWELVPASPQVQGLGISRSPFVPSYGSRMAVSQECKDRVLWGDP